MKLLPKEVEVTLPKLYATENVALKEKMLLVKYFTPDSSWSWYVCEYDKEERLFFGFVDGNFPEWGYFSLDELLDVVGPLGLKIERDLYFNPIKFKDLKL